MMSLNASPKKYSRPIGKSMYLYEGPVTPTAEEKRYVDSIGGFYTNAAVFDNQVSNLLVKVTINKEALGLVDEVIMLNGTEVLYNYSLPYKLSRVICKKKSLYTELKDLHFNNNNDNCRNNHSSDHGFRLVRSLR